MFSHMRRSYLAYPLQARRKNKKEPLLGVFRNLRRRFFLKNAYAVVFVFFTGVWLQIAWSTRSSGHTFPLMQMNMLRPFEGFEYSLHNYFATNRF